MKLKSENLDFEATQETGLYHKYKAEKHVAESKKDIERGKFRKANHEWNDVRKKWATSLKASSSTDAFEMSSDDEEDDEDDLWDGQSSVHLIHGKACVQLQGDKIMDGNVDTKLQEYYGTKGFKVQEGTCEHAGFENQD